ncbi:hypothetical protein SAY86_001012 [Trapa natans]|uniref:Uncharacterized protein n=1 Tax=Trapa natans TaxID=22666 RepID=A0AAN7MBW2_TRANT|nr:hypothetical protein SAY86_001012 [Trapa natans]
MGSSSSCILSSPFHAFECIKLESGMCIPFHGSIGSSPFLGTEKEQKRKHLWTFSMSIRCRILIISLVKSSSLWSSIVIGLQCYILFFFLGEDWVVMAHLCLSANLADKCMLDYLSYLGRPNQFNGAGGTISKRKILSYI